MLLSWMFISSYTTIYFFECLYFSEYGIRMSLHVFLLKKWSSIKYAPDGEMRVIQNAYSCVQGELGATSHGYVRTCTCISFHVFGSIFVL